MSWKLTKYKDINGFYSRIYPFLLKKEAENNLPLGLLNSIKTGNKYKNPLLISIEGEGSQVKGVFIMTPPHHLVTVLEVDEKDYRTVAEELNKLLSEEGITVPGFVCEKAAAQKLTEVWCGLKGCHYEIGMNQRIYKLDHVNDIASPEGRLVTPKEENLQLLTEWIAAFTIETGVHTLTENDALERAKDMISNEKYLYFWEVDGKPVSMARGGRWTDNGITVNFVYTPKPYRKNGYASAVVAGLSRILLKEFEFCTLYTDLENPTSNKIYMEIGYEPICDSLMINLTDS
ncbi:GNAT family N-acetyltransferase [Bacillus sp. Marseille-Q1617]|uniref:GNAT family N-acetyltransferase n=1 Tax=Bacillus sp. Marseille-Q1617 TaxID=2736887 RepID=UPI00158C4621|nr:GNAT family N-acetyltransferase [Bacillus sp. Marseille-Q1617]